jgi:hypothetical protein
VEVVEKSLKAVKRRFLQRGRKPHCTKAAHLHKATSGIQSHSYKVTYTKSLSGVCIQSCSYKVIHTKSLSVCVRSHSYKVTHTKSLILSHFWCVYKATHTKSLILSHFWCVYKATHIKVTHTKSLSGVYTKLLIQSHSY